MKKTANSRIA